ncbi:MAG: Holliday junction branch migration protein RuvA [Patescibacteria group bacterium]
MIALIKGKIELKANKFVIIDVAGVGYKVYCPISALKKIGEQGQEAKLFTHLYVRENVLDLYGFLSFEELDFFELLLSISGIGPKAGLAVFSIASLKDLKTSIASGQVNLLTKVSGIGKKTAERVILELKSKILVSGAEVQKLISDDEAIDALISLGYTQHQAQGALKQVPAKVKQIEQRIKEALKILGQK